METVVVASWRKCRSCSKVKETSEFDGDSVACLLCDEKEARAAARAAKKAAGPVTTTRRPAAPRASRAVTAPKAAVAAPPAAARVVDPLGAVGLGDIEAREKRARRRALDALVEEHGEEFGALHRAARATHAATAEDDVRARRARREAVDALVEANPGDFSRLLEGFRGEEALRPRSGGLPPVGADAEAGQADDTAATEDA